MAAKKGVTFQPTLDLAGKYIALDVYFQRPISNLATVWEIASSHTLLAMRRPQQRSASRPPQPTAPGAPGGLAIFRGRVGGSAVRRRRLSRQRVRPQRFGRSRRSTLGVATVSLPMTLVDATSRPRSFPATRVSPWTKRAPLGASPAFSRTQRRVAVSLRLN
jgi:hypothetical protein